MNANSYNEITAEAQRGIEIAAERLDVEIADVQGYYLAGGNWDAETAAELADLIVECWQEQNRQD